MTTADTETVKVAPCGAPKCQGHVVEDERPTEAMVQRAIAIARDRPRVAPTTQPTASAASGAEL